MPSDGYFPDGFWPDGFFPDGYWPTTDEAPVPSILSTPFKVVSFNQNILVVAEDTSATINIHTLRVFSITQDTRISKAIHIERTAKVIK